MTQASYVQLSEGRQIGFQEYGDPDGKPVFFFHGWLGSRLDFAPNSEIATELGVRVISVDRPGCGASDFQRGRTLLGWTRDIAELADELGFERFAVCGHSFGGPFVAACAKELGDRITSASIVAGISPLSFKGATKGMMSMVRFILWVGGFAPQLLRPYVALMSKMIKSPGFSRKMVGSQLPDAELALLDSPRFEGFFEGLGEMTKNGSKGAYWDARVFMNKWGFDCSEIQIPVSLFYGTADKNVPIQMGEYYRDAIPGAKAIFYEDEGHFIMFTRAREILNSLI
ncbi:MAG: alpha/beta hydrolase [Chloroflexi bacterium]|jgi:pimeloyl-ACP methyl ester carboxylesterase|nr:alpha/beta hydrolase [Chloroflexota bacterium]